MNLMSAILRIKDEKFYKLFDSLSYGNAGRLFFLLKFMSFKEENEIY